MRSAEPNPGNPLAGLRVIELARILAGPWCGQLLADLGAEVIKIEKPDGGDDTRHWGPPFLNDADGNDRDAAYFHAANRGKTSVAIDIASPEGQAQVRELVSSADVLIENFKVGGLARYGLDHASLSAINPGLVTCSITGFGQTGPYAHRAGYDFIIQAMGGAMSLTGEPDGTPQKAGVAYVDIFTGIYSAVAILAALRQRDSTGRGCHIDMALLDVQVGVLANQALNWMASGQVPRRMGNGHPNLVPYQAFACSDGELVIAVGNDAQFRRLADILKLDLGTDPRFVRNADRVANRGALIAAITRATLEWRRQDLADSLERAGIPNGKINDIGEVFADPQVIARGMQIAVDGLPGLAGPIVIDGHRPTAEHGSPARPVEGRLAMEC